MTFTERCDLLQGAFTPRQIAHGAARWLTDTFAITEGAKMRLRAWAQAGGPSGPYAACYVGAACVGAAVDAVLARIPPPVAWHVARSVLVVGSRDEGGWFTTLPHCPVSDEARQMVVVNSVDEPDGEVLAGVIAHEIAHSWTADVLAPDAVQSSASRRQYAANVARVLAVMDPCTARDWLRPRERWEWRAATLAAEWGFTGPATDPEHAARGVARLAATGG